MSIPFTSDEVAAFEAQLDSSGFEPCVGCGAPWRQEWDGSWARDHATNEFAGSTCRFVAWLDEEYRATLTELDEALVDEQYEEWVASLPSEND
jgi:hypothetical protein